MSSLVHTKKMAARRLWCVRCLQEVTQGQQYQDHGKGGVKHTPSCEAPRPASPLFSRIKSDAGFLLLDEWYLPTQWLIPRTEQPERQLLAAILADALECLNKPTRHLSDCRLAEVAAQWFLSEDEAPFTFVFTCYHLNLDAGRMRAALMPKIDQAQQRWQEVQQSSGARMLMIQQHRAAVAERRQARALAA